MIQICLDRTYIMLTRMKIKVRTLRDDILDNVDYLSEKHQQTNDILHDLNRMLHLDMSHTLMFLWWDENENSINTINELLKKVEQ